MPNRSSPASAGKPRQSVAVGGRHWLAAALVGALYLTLVLPLVVSGVGGTSEATDQNDYHLPIVRTMVEQWPGVDLVNYNSATAPGYHLLLAGVLRITGAPWTMWAINTLLSVGLIIAATRFVSRFVRPLTSVALVLPLVFSPYVLGGGIWLTTDNAALLLVALATGGTVMTEYRPARGLLLGVFAAAAVFIRQVHIWLAVPVGLAGLVASPAAAWLPKFARDALGHDDPQQKHWSSLAVSCFAAAMPVVVLVVLVWMWGGLIPRAVGEPVLHDKDPNLAAPAFGLALTAILGVPFLTVVRGPLALLHVRAQHTALAAGFGLAAALLPATSFFEKPRAYGWLWRIVREFPAPFDRSIVITLAAPVGGLVLLVLYRAAVRAERGRAAILLLLSMLAWVCAQSVNSMAWQRYFDPMILMTLAWLAALGVRPNDHPSRRATLRLLVGPLLLAGFQAAISAITLYREAIGAFLAR